MNRKASQDKGDAQIWAEDLAEEEELSLGAANKLAQTERDVVKMIKSR